jgi:hypothetical protein
MLQSKPTPRSVLTKSLFGRYRRPDALSDDDANAWLAMLHQKTKPSKGDRALINYLERGGRSIRP